MNKSRVRIETNFFIYLFTFISILFPSLAKKIHQIYIKKFLNSLKLKIFYLQAWVELLHIIYLNF